MDVQEFVAETLKQVTTAIVSNDSTLSTGGVGVDGLQKLNIIQNFSGWITAVDFDIAVTESKSKEGGAKLSIAGIGGMGGDLAEGTETVSRIKFRVPIYIEKN